MKKSIFARTFVVFLCAMLVVQILAYLVVSFFAEDIYNQSKFKQSEDLVKLVNLYVDGNQKRGLPASVYYAQNRVDIEHSLDSLRFKTGARITLIDENNHLVYGEFWSGEGLVRQPKSFQLSIPVELINLKPGKHIIYEFANKNGKIVEYLYGQRFENGMLAVIEMPLETITESVAVIKKILGFTTLLAAIISVISTFILSKSMTRPLVKINRVASEIGQLNFGVKYEDKREDEIGQIGETLNELSYRLEATIEKLQKELEKEKTLEALRKQFIAQASHEMQTPLAIIKSYTEAIEDGVAEDEKEREQYLNIISSEADKMSKMVKEMLEISQIEAGAFTISKQKFCITQMLDEIDMKYSGFAEQRDVAFEFHNTTQDYYIMGDRFRLEQVVSNFMSNAFKHTEKGKKIILDSKEKNGNIKICVFNQGHRINEQDLPYIWETFYKAKTVAGEKGTGLGLAISKHILTLHHSDYGVINEEDGVTFWFEVERMK